MVVLHDPLAALVCPKGQFCVLFEISWTRTRYSAGPRRVARTGCSVRLVFPLHLPRGPTSCRGGVLISGSTTGDPWQHESQGGSQKRTHKTGPVLGVHLRERERESRSVRLRRLWLKTLRTFGRSDYLVRPRRSLPSPLHWKLSGRRTKIISNCRHAVISSYFYE